MKNQIIVFDQKINLCKENQKKNEIVQMVLDMLGLNSSSQCMLKSSEVYCQTNKKVLIYTKSLEMMFNMLEGEGKISNSKIIFTHDTGKSCFDVEHEIIMQ
jgi:hypothetical protein